nr:Ribosomal protein S3 [Pedinophyceae sp. YPF-701]
MGQKTHPLGFRLGVTQEHQSTWFSNPKTYSNYVLEDSFLRNLIQKEFSEAGIVKIGISRKLEQIRIEIDAARPGIFLGAAKNNTEKTPLEALREKLERKLTAFRNKATRRSMYTVNCKTGNTTKRNTKLQLSIQVNEIEQPDLQATFLADLVTEQLEKRIPFRRAMKQVVQRAQRANAQGIKIEVSGRLNGAEIARTEWIREGRVPLQTLRADIDYSYKTAQTIYGILGVKVWVFRA